MNSNVQYHFWCIIYDQIQIFLGVWDFFYSHLCDEEWLDGNLLHIVRRRIVVFVPAHDGEDDIRELTVCPEAAAAGVCIFKLLKHLDDVAVRLKGNPAANMWSPDQTDLVQSKYIYCKASEKPTQITIVKHSGDGISISLSTTTKG
jgi:hypothetical protein